MKRKIYKGSRYSYVLSIPKELLKALGWKSGQFVEVNKKGKSLKIKDSK